ncbi:hypothetical protein AK973_0656 [Pseudomonas brassicacearum]|nr:hypothetical protein AK973_0656 [Pseudomonas brassicacearum]
MLSQRDICCFGGRYREQARSHRGPAANTNLVNNRNPLWERACSRWGR